MNVIDAEKIVASLEQKRLKLIADGTDLQDARANIAAAWSPVCAASDSLGGRALIAACSKTMWKRHFDTLPRAADK